MNAPTLASMLEPPAFVPGVFDDMPAARYHEVEALSSSGAKKLLRSPAHYKLMRETPNAPTDAMIFGTCVHEGVLEPGTFDARVCCKPKFDMRKTVDKEASAAFAAANEGKLLLTPDDFDRARRCIDAVLAHPAAQALLDGARRELSLFWYDGAAKVPCKARLDLLNGGIGDLKTCQDAGKEKFSRTIADYSYHAQAWHYYSGAEHALDASPEFFAFIAVESEPPHAVAVYKLDRPSMLAGADLIDEALSRYKRCLESGSWPGYAPTIEPINVPRWALRSFQ